MFKDCPIDEIPVPIPTLLNPRLIDRPFKGVYYDLVTVDVTLGLRKGLLYPTLHIPFGHQYDIRLVVGRVTGYRLLELEYLLYDSCRRSLRVFLH